MERTQLLVVALLLAPGCADTGGTRALPELDRAGNGTGGEDDGSSGSGSEGDAPDPEPLNDGNRWEDTEGNKPFEPGCVGVYDCESGDFKYSHPDKCHGTTEVMEVWTEGTNDAENKVCNAVPKVEFVDCNALCQEAGHESGQCVDTPYECFGEDITSGVCECDVSSYLDSDDGYAPQEAGCVAEATFSTCQDVFQEEPDTDWCNGFWLEEQVVDNGGESCGPSKYDASVDCDVECGEDVRGTCVEETIDCLGAQVTAARCSCEDGSRMAKDSDGGDDPFTPGCLGEFEMCSDAHAIGAVPDRCEDELFLLEGYILDGECGYRETARINCGTACMDAGLGWGRCGAMLESGKKIDCYGLEVTAEACICDEGPRKRRDLENGPQPDVPGLTEVSILGAQNCANALPGYYDQCPEVLGEELWEVVIVQGTEESEPCGQFMCCDGLRWYSIDCEAWCEEQGRGEGTCETVGMPHPDNDNMVDVGYCDCEEDGGPPEPPFWGSTGAGSTSTGAWG